MSKYVVGSYVVVNNDGRYEVGLVTNVRRKKNQIVGYDVRTERGSGLPIVQVDKHKTTYWIDSRMTDAWNAEHPNQLDATNLRMTKVGHTRSNMSYDVEANARIDGDSGKVGHYEKYHDFIFPTIGARSY